MPRQPAILQLGHILMCALALGCSSSDDMGDERLGGRLPGGSGSDGDGDGAAGVLGSDNPNNLLISAGSPAPPPMLVELNSDEEGMCGATSYQAEEVIIEEIIETEMEVTRLEPVAIYLMLDQSASMILLWPGAVASVTQFVQDPMSVGLDVAIQYFPGSGQCNGSGYDTPEVPMGPLPANTQPIVNSLNAHQPFGIGTPIEGALRGVTSYCETFQANNPDEKCIAVLITDGAPNGCDETQNSLVQLATNAYSNGVLTYAVGFNGADFNLLNRIAMEGGGEDCDPGANYACDVTADPGQLVVALNKIRAEVTTTETVIETVITVLETPLECEWEIPEGDTDLVFDPEKVNVLLTGTNIADLPLGKVSGTGDCAANGWHFDDADDPQRIVACAETCDMIQSTAGAGVGILLGCKTIVLE